MKLFTASLLIFAFNTVYAQFTTPGTGVNWTTDSLVAFSAGVVTGTFPNYTISNKITIAATDKVTIAPGTTLTINGSTSGFEVNGALRMAGLVNDSIYVTSASSDSLGSAYDGFRFNGTSIDEECLIEYVSMKFAYYGARCLDASPTIRNSYFYKVRRPFQLSSSSPVITGNRIERSYEYGITLTLGSSPDIENNHFINNNTQNTSPKNQISIGTQGNNSPLIRNNIVEGGMFHRTGGISISALIGGSSSSSLIEGNIVKNNSFGISLAGGNITAQVRNNIFENNNINPDPNVSGSGINVNGNSQNVPVFMRNVVTGNLWGVTVQNGTSIQAGPQPNFGNLENSDTSDNGYNKITGNLQGSTPYDFFNNCTNDIYAQNNDWGVYDSSAIELKIVHKVDDPLRGTVFFMPFYDPNLIPVELISFYAASSENSVTLFWETATELNNSGFEIERKSSTDADFIKIGFVSGNGTTLSREKYSFLDNNLNNGVYFYRLKQIDYSGEFSYSNTIATEITSLPVESRLIQNYPNPFNPVTTIPYYIGGDAEVKVSIRIYDITGAEAAVLVEDVKKPGFYEVVFNPGFYNLASGVYYYELTAGAKTEVKKLILNK
ncbi:MAG: right-handed parallel beta-helix repeat-containing protein [Ignavibacteriaceae bacterium]|nr:right-handed parallel beta-helix repeat-containing protein [Ignavibacteriaceae bacterium]